jgi:hypothetical protein
MANARPFTRRALMGTIVGSLLVVALTSGPAFSAKPPPGGSGYSVKLMPVGQVTSTTWPNFGNYVTFAGTAPNVAAPYVLNECFQGGVRVSGEVHGFYDGALWGQTYQLGPTSMWTGGDANCTGTLYTSGRNGKRLVLATTSYHVTG